MIESEANLKKQIRNILFDGKLTGNEKILLVFLIARDKKDTSQHQRAVEIASKLFWSESKTLKTIWSLAEKGLVLPDQCDMGFIFKIKLSKFEVVTHD